MTEFVFTGDPRMAGRDQTEKCDLFGMTFHAGVPVPVEDKAIAAKLRRHSHFAEVEAAAHTEAPRRGRPPNASKAG